MLCFLLSLPDEAPVFATQSFDAWLRPPGQPSWPPPSDIAGGLYLLDTRDHSVYHRDALFRAFEEAPRFDAALVLAGSGRAGGAVRRVLRRLRGETRRLPEGRVAAEINGSVALVQRFAFTEQVGVPNEFESTPRAGWTGTAFLLTRDPPFAGPIWSFVRDRLGVSEFEVLGFQVRARGAAIVTISAGGAAYVIRVVPPDGSQTVVRRNHVALSDLRDRVRTEERLLSLMPEPLFAGEHGSALVLAETCVAGTLAWKVASGPLAHRIHDNAVAFLAALERASTRELSGDSSPRRLLDEDLKRVDQATFAGATVRDLIRQELGSALETFGQLKLTGYTSHGDYGYGNILVDPGTGEIEGVIDWDTSRPLDFPGIDRVNLEIQIRGSRPNVTFPDSVEMVWRERAAQEALQGSGDSARVRALFGIAVCRYIIRSFSYPAIYQTNAARFEQALAWLSRTRQ